MHITLLDPSTKRPWGAADWQSARPAETTQWRLLAARGEVVGVQLQFTADHDFVLLLDQGNWLHPLGFCPRLRLEVAFPSLPPQAVQVFAIGYLEGDDRRLWPESLDPAGYAEVPAGRPQGVYLRLRLPADLPPGEHLGSLRCYAQRAFEDERLVWQGAVRLSVASTVLPPVAEWSFHLNLWQHLTALARHHRTPLWSEAHFAVIERYYASLAQLGQKAVSLVVAEIPWSGQRCYRDQAYPSYLFEHAIVATRRDLSGALLLDFSALDRTLALAARYGMDREIDLFGLLNVWVDEDHGFGKVAPDAPDAIRVRCYDQACGAFTYLCTAAELSAYISALHQHFSDLGLLDRVRITADEPADLAAFQERLAFVQQAAPGFRYSVAINHLEFMENVPPAVVDAVPILPHACQDPSLTAALANTLHQRGGRLLWYVCCWPPIPNTFLHSPLLEGRLLGWLTYYLKLDGFLRWAFCLWPADPWRRVSWRAPAWPAGDMYFVLPGPDGAPVETLRYEALRAAVQDYQLLRLVEQRLPTERAEAAIAQAFQCLLRASPAEFSWVASARPEALYSLDPADYARARGILLEALAE
jgi:hypothetical protein